MQTTADRIKQRMMELDISQADIHRATGAGKATISSWIEGTTEPSSKYLVQLACKLGCEIEWLLTGKETSRYEHSQVNHLNNSYVGDSINQSVIRQCASGEDLVSVDFYPQANFDADKQVFCTTKQTIPVDIDFITMVVDNLMQPIICQKSLVAVRKLQDRDLIYPSKVYVVNMHGLLICRYLERMTGGRVRVYSEQDKTGQILDQAAFDDEYQIMGAVVWQAGFLE